MGAVLVAVLPRRIQPRVVPVTGPGKRKALALTLVEGLCITMVTGPPRAGQTVALK
jgi:hypothetical protein